MENPWIFLPFGYLFSILIETPILLIGLSPRHPMSRRFFAGIWLTACTYPIVVIVLPEFWDPGTERFTYLLVAETFAPVAECLLFLFAFGLREQPSSGGRQPSAPDADRTARSQEAASPEGHPHIYEKQEGITTPADDTGLHPSTDPRPAPVPSVVKVDYWSVGRDMVTIIVANLASFGLGELVYAMGWVRGEWFNVPNPGPL